MNRAANIFFNLVTMLFVVLTVTVLVVVLGIGGDAVDPPIFAPKDAAPLPTEVFLATYTPIPTA
ncbi:MAG: hypothetical protein K8S97_09320, partial [Anaerolineae bacterium]|nr:hypothetical protein [Anaerolineae bacterium]